MTTLLTPPAGDTRSAEEYTYDLIQAGQYYTAAPAATEPIPSLTITTERRTVDGWTFTEYRCGDVTATLYQDSNYAPDAILFGHDPIDLDKVIAALPPLIALLMHPDIQAVCRGHITGSPWVKVKHGVISEPDEPPIQELLFEAGRDGAAEIDFQTDRYIDENVTALETSPFSPQVVMRCLPHLVALFTDPRVQAQLAIDAKRKPVTTRRRKAA